MDNIESRKVSAAGGVFRSRQAIIAGVGLAIAVVIVVVARGTIAAPPTIVGKYRDSSGKGTIEFLANGSMVITVGSDSNSAKWEKLDDTRLRIEPSGLGFLGQVCQYKFDGRDALKISDCAFRADLTRF